MCTEDLTIGIAWPVLFDAETLASCTCGIGKFYREHVHDEAMQCRAENVIAPSKTQKTG